MPCTKSAISNASLSENALYVGINLQSILYGVQLGLYFKTIHVFLTRRREPRRSDAFYAVFSSAMLLLITIRVATEGVYGEKMWLTDQNYPGGPFAYAQAHTSEVYMDLGAAAVVTLQLMTDAFMIYRCRLVWNNLRAIVVPSILWLANLVLGILFSWDAAAPWTIFLDDISAKLELVYTAVSAALNLTLTCMVWYGLLRRARAAREFHEEERALTYFTVGALVVESMLPYTLCGIALLITCGAGSAIGIAFSCVYTMTTCISPQMLILRIAEGDAWQRDKTDVVSRDASGAERSDGSGTVALVHLATLRYGPDK